MVFEKELNLREKWLCLDFANTCDWHISSQPVETLIRYTDLVAWCQQVGLITTDEAHKLELQAGKEPGAAEATLQRAIELREAIYRIITTLVNGRAAETGDMELLNREIANSAGDWKLNTAPGGFAWGWDSGEKDLSRMLGPIVHSAADLLISGELQRVGICADEDGCGFVFYDTSRNRSRRWCSMDDCGNRAKAQRHYQRQKDNEQ
jgi:predicted RNA-binding Zn ribbon-like protein